MDFVRLSISRPITVAVGVILVVMFGLIGFSAVPVQLAPNVDEPKITVSTAWPGRSPEEIVDEIIKKQEEQLKNVSNLKAMKSTSRQGSGEIELDFYIGTDISRALQEVSDSMRQVEDYPLDVTEPAIKAADGASDPSSAIAWIILDLPREHRAKYPDFDISTLFRPLDQEVKPYLERVDGIAEINIYGGREQEMQIRVDPMRLAQRGLNHLDLLAAIQAENQNISAGSIEEGKRDYRIRVLGQFEDEDDILDTIVAYREGGQVLLKDIATVELDYERRRGFVRSLGEEAIAINAIRQSNANVVEVMADLRQRLEEVRTEILPGIHPEVGPLLRMRQVYDETTYIDSAIGLVTSNLFVGGGIAIIVLLLFLRSFVATGVTAVAIPVSVVGTFLVLLVLGRTLNVISLAGLAFAVGMVVDNAIVVLENIYRHRQMGKPPVRAAYDGGREVIGAIIASTLTTVAVFVPVLTVQEEAGQLFRDISLAIVASVTLSLIVSITVIPAAMSRFMRAKADEHEHGKFRKAFESLFGLAPALQRMNRYLGERVYWVMTGWRGWSLRPAIIIVMTAASLIGALMLKPPLDYLPAGNRNLVFGGLLIPPGYSIEQMEQIANRIEDQIRPYVGVAPDDRDSLAGLDPIPRRGEGIPPYRPVGVENFFIGSFNGTMFIGGTSMDEQVVLPVGQLLSNSMSTIPDSFGGASQSSLFGRGIGGGNSIDIEIMGPDLDRVVSATGFLFGSLMQDPRFGPTALQPNPANFSLAQQEFRVRVNSQGRELGIRTDGVGTAVRALFDGAYAGDFRTPGQSIDIRLVPAGGRLVNKEQIAGIPIATPRGPVVSMDTVVDFEPGLAPQEIRRIEELPSVTLSVRPPDGEPLESVMRDIRENYISAAEQAGLIDKTMRVRLEGTAAQLDEVTKALFGIGLSEESDAGGRAAWQVAADIFGVMLLLAGLGVGVYSLVKCFMKRKPAYGYATAGALVLGTILFSIFFFGIGSNPELLMGRVVWSVIVVYLLMCALFESFVYPFVIMFSVPLALVGGFAGLAIVHATTAANPYIATQNLDVLTMLGIVILVGVVVNNAILIVHQALNLMRGTGDVDPSELPDGYEPGQPMEPMRAIAESVKTRTRPVFMSTMTSVGGMLPLVLFPGAGSELYRGLGSVVVGGLLVSTVFTLLLVPLVFGLTLQMTDGLRMLFGMQSSAEAQKRDLGREMLGLKPDASKETLEAVKRAEPVGA